MLCIFAQNFTQLLFHTENQWKCGWTSVEILPVCLVFQDIKISMT